jgi:uncharacterized protein (TIGR02757 family)
VVRPRRPAAELSAHLRALYDRFPFDRSLAEDPLSSVRPFAGDPRAAEIAGVFASTLAIGNTTAIRGSFARLVAHAGGDLPGWVDATTPRNFATRLGTFRHRWIRADQMGYLALRLRVLHATYPSLEELFLEGFDAGGFPGGLDRLAHGFRGDRDAAAPRPPPGYLTLFPSPYDAPAASACKRLTLFVRWMVRERYPDLGLWRRVPAGELRVPLDQHVHWIAYHVGLTGRRSKTWAAVEEVSEALRRVDPMDPVRFDFVLCHTGVSGDCPKRRDLSVCGPCVLRPDCLLWRGKAAA